MQSHVLKIAAALVLILLSIGWLLPLYFGWQLQLHWLQLHQAGQAGEAAAALPEAARFLGNVAAYWFLLALLFWIFFAARKLIPWSE